MNNTLRKNNQLAAPPNTTVQMLIANNIAFAAFLRVRALYWATHSHPMATVATATPSAHQYTSANAAKTLPNAVTVTADCGVCMIDLQIT